MPHGLASNIGVMAVVVLGVGVALAVLMLLAFRRWVLPRMNVSASDGEFAGAMVQAILVFYALAVALVAVNSWDRHGSVDDQTSTEAATVATLYREAELFPEPVRSEVQTELERYVRYIIDEAWPAQARGDVPAGGTEHITAVQEALGAFEPSTNAQQAVYERALDTFDRVVELRRLRLDSVAGHLSTAMWVFVVGGGALALFASFFFAVGDWRLHAAMVGLLAMFIGMVVVLIAAYDQPFVGSLGIEPDSFVLVLDAVSGG